MRQDTDEPSNGAAGTLRHWDAIDALRGIAAMGVVLVHAARLFPRLPWRAAQLAGLGLHGVQLFFMVSAVTLALSWQARAPREASPARAFFIRRFFRIAPMFWAAGAAYLAMDAFVAPFWKNGTVDGLSIFLTAIFCYGWLPATINSVVPGGWSIADEMMFYLAFPALITMVVNLRRALFFFGIAVLVALTANQLAPILYDPRGAFFLQFVYFWLPNQLPVFALGFVTFHLIPWARAAGERRADLLLVIGIALLLGVAFGGLPYWSAIGRPMPWRDLVAGAGFMAIILSLTARPRALLVNRCTRLIGEVSFSSYLLQFAVIQMAWSSIGPSQLGGIKAVLVFCIVVPCLISLNTGMAFVTYRLIERPLMRVGHRLARNGTVPAEARTARLP
jgi:peptidoglycan/LPS O-acetylase OafA/YrhL